MSKRYPGVEVSYMIQKSGSPDDSEKDWIHIRHAGAIDYFEIGHVVRMDDKEYEVRDIKYEN